MFDRSSYWQRTKTAAKHSFKFGYKRITSKRPAAARRQTKPVNQFLIIRPLQHLFPSAKAYIFLPRRYVQQIRFLLFAAMSRCTAPLPSPGFANQTCAYRIAFHINKSAMEVILIQST